MGQQRVKGQEATITITVGGELEAEITDIHNFEAVLEFDNPTMGYLGRMNDDVDEVFKRCSGSMEIHMHSDDLQRLQKRIIDRAQRRTPDLVIALAATLAMPDGSNPTKVWGDVRFGTMTETAGARGDFVNVKVPWYQGEPPVFQFDD